MGRRLGVVLGSATLILFSFQNCGRSNFETYDDADLLRSSGVALDKATSPVPFELGLDAIAYNSCVPNNPAHEAYFTLRATAGGSRGGARLTQEFLSGPASQLKPILGNPDVIDVQYKQLIEAMSPETEVQVALRATNDYLAAYAGKEPAGIWGRMDMLSHDAWLTPLVDSARRNGNQWVPYSARAPSSKGRFDFSFKMDLGSSYWQGLVNAQSFRTCVSQGCQGYGRFAVAAGFSDPSNKNVIRGPAATSTSQVSAYGRGYMLQLGYPDNRAEAGMRVVKGILEYNMQNQAQVVENNVPTQWHCTEIPIMSSSQRGPASNPQTSTWDRNKGSGAQPLCQPMTGNYASMNFNELKLAKVREVLPSHQWQLGLQPFGGTWRLCAIPVGFDCYPNDQYPNIQQNGSSQPFPYYVSYFPGSPGEEKCLNEDNLGIELSKTGQDAIANVCAHYITVCTKQ